MRCDNLYDINKLWIPMYKCLSENITVLWKILLKLLDLNKISK